MQNPYDIIIIGAGIVGTMIARTLARYNLRILWIEKASDICTGATAANSALIHAGHDAIPGSLKAEMNVKANPMWDQLSAELHFAFGRTGAYVVAVGPDEYSRLEQLLARAQQNGVPAEIISGEEMRRREPQINPEVSGALYVPSGAIVDPWGATIAAAENAVMNGVELRLNTEFLDFIFAPVAGEDLKAEKRIIGIETNQGEFYARWVINAAGLFADEVMHKAGVRPDFRITPRRGEYFVMDRNQVEIKNVLFPVPTAISKGILVTTTLHGNTLVGPNAENLDDKTDVDVTPAGMAEIWSGALKLVPGLKQRDVIAVFAGLRPGGNAPCADPHVAYNHDFIIEIPAEPVGFVNLGGMESPALTAAPAIAERVLELLRGAGEALDEKPDWNPIRPGRPVFRHLSKEEQAQLIGRDPRYGRIICRCESVTEGEIVAEIHAPIPATTYDAIKRRTWLGTGRCLGGFDMPRVVEILARELDRDVLEISKKGAGSEFLYRKTKETA
ncbi:MAG: NAD(P)/FAD-dependent oxidoreductase [Anaerolineae bacterium]|jgi:glycerol-3-phosphate dehydrogenase|nr:NAD(P)/FAD-dependent oxidoreductase [Anaerolineae bacterium]